jgi:hypothetical protein
VSAGVGGPPLFVELCAGTAALSLRLHRDGARPPVSRMGAKTGYADVILRVLGLIPGQRADRYLWCEPDPGVRLLLHAYRSAPLAKAAAAIIRGWAAEDPRALWERLRAEGPPRLPDGEVDAGEVARWAVVGRWSVRAGDPSSGYSGPDVWAQPTAQAISAACDRTPTLPATITPDARHIDPREVARWAQITASNRLIHTAWSDAEGRWVNTGDGGATFGGDAFATPPERTAEGFDAAPGDVPAVVVPDAREVDPREVARWAVGEAWQNGGRYMGPDRPSSCHPPGWTASITAEGLARRADALPAIDGALIHPDAREVDPREVARWAFVQSCNTMIALDSDWRNTGAGGSTFHGGDRAGDPFRAAGPLERTNIDGALIHPDARDIDPPALPPGTVVYMDPPYLNTTGYAHDLPRAEVVAIARRWAAAGATVAISEAEPIPELVAEGWYAVRIDGERVGQKRTFSKQQAEWLTLSRPPAWVPPVQGGLFGGGR